MTTYEKMQHGTAAWFEMVGTIMVEAARRAGPPGDLNVSLMEYYTDGGTLSDGLNQGIRFDIVDGQPSYRAGARPQETADIVIEVTAAAARELNGLRSADPKYNTALRYFIETGQLRMDGDISLLGDWFATVHDLIVERTA